MTHKVLDWRKAILDAPEKMLGSTTVLILLAMSVYMDDSGYCYPSINRLMKNTRLSKRAVIEHVMRAVRAGYLKKGTRMNAEGKAHNDYHALIPPRVSARVTEDNPGYPDSTSEVTQGNPNSPIELPIVSGDDDAMIIFKGKVIRLSRKDFEARRTKYGLETLRFADWLENRDKWLRTLPAKDRRVANWWASTWQALERDLDSLRACDRYAKTRPAEPLPIKAEESPNVVVWG